MFGSRLSYENRKRLAALLTLVIMLAGCGAVAEDGLVIPAEVTVIEEEAFYRDEGITSVTLPDTVLYIGPRAFAYSGLREINLPASLSLIEDDAFEGCTGLVASAGQGSYAYGYCIDHGITVSSPVSVYHPDLEGNVLWLDSAETDVGTEVSLRLRAAGAWTLSISRLRGTEVAWVAANAKEGSGPATVKLKVLALPDITNLDRDHFAARLTFTCGEDSCSVIVALAKDMGPAYDGTYINTHLNTGTYMEDFLTVLQSQVGYRGGTTKTALDGSPAKSGPYTKYGDYSGINGSPWGGALISWAAHQAAVPLSVLSQGTYAQPDAFTPGVKKGDPVVYYFNALTDEQRNKYPYLSRYGIRLDRNSDWEPQRGDFIFLRWKNATPDKAFSSVGVVIGYENGVIRYINGNEHSESLVALRSIRRTDETIAAYYTPW